MLQLKNLSRLQSKAVDITSLSSPEGTVNLPLNQIFPNPKQPRRYFSQQDLENLASSLKARGLLNPIIVRPHDKTYQLVAGERRYRAALLLNWSQIPVKILELDDSTALEISLMENLQREDLNPLEQTEAILCLLQQQLKKNRQEIISLLYRLHNEHTGKITTNTVIGSEVHITLEAVFSQIGHIDLLGFVSNRLPLLNLPEQILVVLREGKIAYTKAQAIAKVKDEEVRGQLLEEAITQNLSLNQIKARIIELMAKEQEASPPSQITPQQEITDISQRLKKSELWKTEPVKWKKAQSLLKKISVLLEEDGNQN
jgi:ParB family chromosome partitioning protein